MIAAFVTRWLIFAQVQVDPGELHIPTKPTGTDTFSNILKIVFGTFGAIAVIIITVAGIQYVMSQGDPQATGKAKSAIIDAMIGLLVTILAYSIINFIVTRL